MSPEQNRLSIQQLHDLYRSGEATPETVIDNILSAAKNYEDYNIWITLLDKAQIQPYLASLEKKSLKGYPLYGIPFAIKDNINLENVPTTAACPDYAYTPEKTAFAVQQLIAAGAIPVGKTNLDQFATGLVGTRSPYGACKNSINPEMISGGSSSGSAVAVALGLSVFSLGTDTAGSGRVPAFLNNLVGVKPTLGSVSATGMIPACRTVDTISIFANNAADADTVLGVMAEYDEGDDYSRHFPTRKENPASLTLGVPADGQLEWFGNSESPELFAQSLEAIRAAGHKTVTVDFSPFCEAANLLYHGPWVAERYAAMEEIMQNRPDILHPVTRSIVSQAENYSAVDCFKAMYQLQHFKKLADAVLHSVDLMVIPTAGTHYTIDELHNDPVQLNTNLGYYTNFMNLLDYSALAIPTGFYSNQMPFGITLFADAFEDFNLLALAKQLGK